MQGLSSGRAYGKRGVGRFCSFVGLLVFLSVVAVGPGAKAMEFDMTGRWDLTVLQAQGTGNPPLCQWVGPMMLNQMGMMSMGFTGSMALHRVLGGSQCPAMLDGMLAGTIEGTLLEFSIYFGPGSGQIGQVAFTGTVMEDGQSANGTWLNEASGTWSAQRHRQAVPALGAGALATLFGLLMAGGVLRLRHRSV